MGDRLSDLWAKTSDRLPGGQYAHLTQRLCFHVLSFEGKAGGPEAHEMFWELLYSDALLAPFRERERHAEPWRRAKEKAEIGHQKTGLLASDVALGDDRFVFLTPNFPWMQAHNQWPDAIFDYPTVVFRLDDLIELPTLYSASVGFRPQDVANMGSGQWVDMLDRDFSVQLIDEYTLWDDQWVAQAVYVDSTRMDPRVYPSDNWAEAQEEWAIKRLSRWAMQKLNFGAVPGLFALQTELEQVAALNTFRRDVIQELALFWTDVGYWKPEVIVPALVPLRAAAYAFDGVRWYSSGEMLDRVKREAPRVRANPRPVLVTPPGSVTIHDSTQEG